MKIPSLSVIILPALLFLAIIFIYKSCVNNQDVKHLTAENQLLQLTIAQYASEPDKIDTFYKYIYDTVIINKTFVAVDSIKITDTVYRDTYIKTYKDSIQSKDLTLFYSLKTRGDLLAYGFSYRLKHPQVEKERTATLYKTVYPEKKGRLYVGIGWVLTQPSASLKIDWIHRSNKWGLYYVNIPYNNIHSIGATFRLN